MDPLSNRLRHPILACADQLAVALKSVADVEPGFMSTSDKRAALLALTQLSDQLAGVRLKVIAASADVADLDGHPNVASWLSSRTRNDGGPNRRELRLAEALDRRWTATGAALTEGRVNLAQAHVIAHALDDLPDDEVDADTLASCEAHLIAEAGRFGPKHLAMLGRKVLEVVAPEAFEDAEARKLQDEERHAHKRASLFTRRVGNGMTRISITVSDAIADRLETVLNAFTSPRRAQGPQLGSPSVEKVPHFRKMAHAFCALLETLDPQRLPVHGGDATTVIVTIPLKDLQAQLGAADLGVDGRLSASDVRRLACAATILPAVLGGKSELLDLGRSRRLFSAAQRKAMALRDKTCRAEGCAMPAQFCEAHHHAKPWSVGGKTDLKDGRLLCSFHHHRAHDDSYLHAHLPNGDCRFTTRR